MSEWEAKLTSGSSSNHSLRKAGKSTSSFLASNKNTAEIQKNKSKKVQHLKCMQMQSRVTSNQSAVSSQQSAISQLKKNMMT